ncbi:MAG TPA: hypothetical protein VJU81_03645 [Methylomirabilota bacterium]|nr:hypothetical protein [Methylomirabilota bacterium]
MPFGPHNPRRSRRLRLSACLIAALAMVVPRLAAAADEPPQIAAAVKRIPALRPLTLTPLTPVPSAAGVYTGKLGARAVEVRVFRARQTGGGPAWVASVVSGAKKARELLAPDLASSPGGGSTVLGQLDLVDTVVVFSEQDGEMRIGEIPADLRTQLQRMILPSGPIPLRAGVNVLASVRVATSGPLADVASTLGITAPMAPLTGTLPATSAAVLGGTPPGTTNTNDVDLTLHLPAILPKGLEAVLGSDPLVFTMKGDKGRIVAGGKTKLRLLGPGGGGVTADATLSYDPSPIEGGAFVRLGGSLTPLAAVLPPIPATGLVVDQLDLEVALLRKGAARERSVGLHGKGKLSGAPLDLTGTLAQTPDRRTDVTLTVATHVKVSDLLGRAVPGLDGVHLQNVSLGRDHVGGTVRVGTKDISALVYTPAGKSRANLAIGGAALALADFVPPLRSTPLADFTFSNGVLLVVPPDNAARGLTAAVLPAELVRLLGGPQSDVLARGLDLSPGVSLLATLDVSGSKPLHTLLDAVGVKATRLPLAGTLDPEMLQHTPWGGRAGASALAKSFLEHLNVVVPLPSLTLPGGASALHLTPGSLSVKGDKDKAQIRLAVETGAEITLPDRKLTVSPLTVMAASSGVTLNGAVTGTSHAGGDVKQLVEFPGLTVTTVGFTGQISTKADTKASQLTAALSADGRLRLPAGEKPIKLKVSLDSGDPQAGSIQVLTALTVNDFAPAGTPIPGIGPLAFKDLTLTTTSIAGTVTFRKEDTTVVAWTPARGGDRRFALVHDKLKIGTYVQAVKGTSLGDLELDQTALIYVPKGGAQKGLAAEQLPDRLVAALGGKGSTIFPLDLADGVNVSTLAKLPTAGSLHDLLDGLGITQTALPLRGVLDPAYLSTQSPDADKTGRWPRFTLNLDVPAFRPPGLGDHVAFEKGHVGIVPNKDGKTFGVALAGTVAVTLDPAHVLRFAGSFTRASPGVLTFSADAKVALNAPFGIQWLALDELDLACTIDRQKKNVGLSITGETKINGKPVKVVTRLIEEQGKLKDVVFGLTGHLPMSVVPGLGGVPGMSGLVVVDPEVSRTHVSGEIDFRKAKIKAAVFKDGADWNLLFENSSFRLDQLLPGLAADHLKALTFPKTALLVSHKGFTRRASDLPPPIAAIMADLGLKKDDTVAAMAGVNLVTTLDPHTLTGPLRKATDRLGVQQPVVLAGAIGGLFGGSPSLTLEAFLPHVPVPQTKFLKMDGKADLKLQLALSPTQLSIGVGTDAHLRIGRDNLVFDASFNLIIQPADVIVDITGTLKGDWHNPMGIRGLVLEGVFLSVGIDVTGAAKVSVGGKAQIGDNEALVEAGTSLQLEAAGIPTGLGLVGQMAHLGLNDLIAAADSISHAATGARRSSAGAPKEQAGFKDLTVAFVTPGIVLDKSLLRGADVTIPDEGIALGGTLILAAKEIATVGGYAAPNGIKIGGEVKPFDVGPLHLYKAVVDFQTSTGAKPHFLLKGHGKLLDSDLELDVTVDEGGFAFHTKDQFGAGVEVELDARTTNGFSLKNNDFSVHAELKADIGRHLLDNLKRALESLFADLEAEERTQKAKLADANKTVAEREKALAAARAQVQRERKALVHDVAAVRKKLQDLDHQLKYLPGQINHALRDARAAVRGFRFARAAELRTEAAAWEVELAGARIAFKATDALLKAIESGAADIPIDIDPRVVTDLVALEAARVNAGILDLEVKVLDLVATDLKAAANRLTGADIIDIHRVMLEGTFGTQLRFTVDAKIFGKYDVHAVGAFSPKDVASKAAGLFAVAKDLASHLLSHKRTEHEDAVKPASTPSATAAAPTGPGGAAAGGAAPASAASALGDLGKDVLVGVGESDVDGVVFEISKER